MVSEYSRSSKKKNEKKKINPALLEADDHL